MRTYKHYLWQVALPLILLGAAAVAGRWYTNSFLAEHRPPWHFWWEDPYSQERGKPLTLARSSHINWSGRCDVHGIHLGTRIQDIPGLKETRLMSGMMTYEFDLHFPDDAGPCPAPYQLRRYIRPGVLAQTCVNDKVVSDLIGTDLNQDGFVLLAAGDSRTMALEVMGKLECDVHVDQAETQGNRAWQPSGSRNRQVWATYAHYVGIDEYLVARDPSETWFMTVDLQADRVKRVELHYFESD